MYMFKFKDKRLNDAQNMVHGEGKWRQGKVSFCPPSSMSFESSNGNNSWLSFNYFFNLIYCVIKNKNLKIPVK